MKWNTYGPRLVDAYELHTRARDRAGVCSQVEIAPSTWRPARFLGSASLLQRFRYAWLVFTGRADVLYWPKQEHTE